MRKLTTMVLTATLVAVPLGTSRALDPGEFAYRLPEGGVLVLKQSLTVRPGQSRVYLQGGQPLGFDSVDEYEPNCHFRLKGESRDARVVEAGEFQILRNRREYQVVDATEVAPRRALLKVADPTYEIYGVDLDLASPGQAQVWRFSCRELYGWGDFTAEHLRWSAVLEAVGDLVEFQ